MCVRVRATSITIISAAILLLILLSTQSASTHATVDGLSFLHPMACAPFCSNSDEDIETTCSANCRPRVGQSTKDNVCTL